MNEKGFVVIALAACLLAAVGIIATAAVKNHESDTVGGPTQQVVEKADGNKAE